MKEVPCAQCGIIFGLPDVYEHQLREDHATFYCPNGHSLRFFQESCKDKAVRLERELNKLKEQLPKRDTKGHFIKKN